MACSSVRILTSECGHGAHRSAAEWRILRRPDPRPFDGTALAETSTGVRTFSPYAGRQAHARPRQAGRSAEEYPRRSGFFALLDRDCVGVRHHDLICTISINAGSGRVSSLPIGFAPRGWLPGTTGSLHRSRNLTSPVRFGSGDVVHQRILMSPWPQPTTLGSLASEATLQRIVTSEAPAATAAPRFSSSAQPVRAVKPSTAALFRPCHLMGPGVDELAITNDVGTNCAISLPSCAPRGDGPSSAKRHRTNPAAHRGCGCGHSRPHALGTHVLRQSGAQL
ncbi:hypothetical protein Pd630_LPD13114 (plasmid) [Rhodococcus opacus PD630]|nr:hypothetical protein Pd630_LPD13114 [Rhodococcus opacus PD630]